MSERHPRLGVALVTLGTFAGALMQWYLVWLFATRGGASAVGAYSLVFSVATPTFAVASLGLRNLYLTHDLAAGLRAYLSARLAGSAVAVALVLTAGLVAGVSWQLTLAVAGMKAADSLVDITLAWYQARRLFVKLGVLLCLNPLLSALAATAVVATTHEVTLGVVASGVVSAAVAVVALARVDWRQEPATRVLPVEVVRAGVPVAAAQLLMSLVASVPLWFVTALGGTQAGGVYSAAAYLLVAANLAGASFQTLLIPSLRATRVAQGWPGLRRALRRWLLVGGAIGVPAAVLTWLVLPTVLTRVYASREFFLTEASALALSGGALTVALGYVPTSLLLVANRYSQQLTVSGCAVLGAVLGGLLAAPVGSDPVLTGCLAALAAGVLRLGVALGLVRQSARDRDIRPAPSLT